MTFTVIPDVVSGQTLRSLTPDDTALAAAQLMIEHDISSVLVRGADGGLLGIVTERDLARRVAGADRRAGETPLHAIMSSDIASVAPGDSPYDALETMRDRRVRHLPVMQGTEVVGIVSMRDVRHAIAAHGGAGPPGLLARLSRILGTG